MGGRRRLGSLWPSNVSNSGLMTTMIARVSQGTHLGRIRKGLITPGLSPIRGIVPVCKWLPGLQPIVELHEPGPVGWEVREAAHEQVSQDWVEIFLDYEVIAVCMEWSDRPVPEIGEHYRRVKEMSTVWVVHRADGSRGVGSTGLCDQDLHAL